MREKPSEGKTFIASHKNIISTEYIFRAWKPQQREISNCIHSGGLTAYWGIWEGADMHEEWEENDPIYQQKIGEMFKIKLILCLLNLLTGKNFSLRKYTVPFLSKIMNINFSTTIFVIGNK